MSKRYASKPDLDPTDKLCPFCGREYLPLDYYTASRVSEEDGAVRYENSAKHLGGLCPYCYKKTRNRMTVLVLAVIGAIFLALFVYAIILPLIGVIPVDRGEYFGIGTVRLFGFYETYGWSNILVIIGILSVIPAAISFCVIAALASFKPEKLEIGDDARGKMFFSLRTENKLPPDLVFKTPAEAKELGLTDKNEQE